MNRSYFTFLTFFMCFQTYLVAQPLSESAQLSLITLSPADELYATFGHSAIRILDRENNMDVVYNYGTFNFNTPNFYQKFIQGQLDYMISKSPYYYTEAESRHRKQSLYEQVWELDYEEKMLVYNFLETNMLPQNRYYKYDFFYDNCATRIRDVLEMTLGEAYHCNPQYLQDELTFRDMIDMYLKRKPWADFGIDIALGMPADRKADYRTATFLPDFLLESMENSSIQRDSAETALGNETKMKIKGIDREEDLSYSMTSPFVVMWLLFLITIALTLFEVLGNKKFRAFDIVLFTIVGLVGWLIVFLWFFTDHQTTKSNLNIVWAIPLFFPASFWLVKKITPTFIKYLMTFYSILIVVFLVGWILWPQALHFALIPVCLMLLIRASLNSNLNLKFSINR